VLAPLDRIVITHHHETDHVLECFDLSLYVTGKPPTSGLLDQIAEAQFAAIIVLIGSVLLVVDALQGRPPIFR
jgi:hypothetical protein